MARLRRAEVEILAAGAKVGGTPLSSLVVDDAAREALEDGDVIARIDQDGRLLSHVGPLDAVTVDEDAFLPRRRFQLTVEARAGEAVLVKDFAGDRSAFLAELEGLHTLTVAGCRAPAIRAIDWQGRRLTMTFVNGTPLRLALAAAGARILDSDLAAAGETHSADLERDRGRPLLAQVAPEAGELLAQQIRQAHAAGVVLNDIKYGNVVLVDGRPHLLDLEASVVLRRRGTHWRAARARDLEALNALFGREETTSARLKEILEQGAQPHPKQWYAAAYLGDGLRVGSLLNIQTGHGRWEYLLHRHLPPVEGARVLDLGSNNASMSLQLLAAGAKEVVAVEGMEPFIEQGRFLHQALEWRDARRYDLRYIHADMAEVPDLDLGTFDMVQALCSLYYLSPEDMARVTRHVAAVSPVFVLQCNTEEGIGRPEDEYEKASVAYAQRLLEENGFPHTTVVAPRRYSRPLVIGRREPA